MKDKNNISGDRKKYLKKQKNEKILIKVVQFSIVIGLIVLWEVLANKGIIDSFIMSQPSRILKTFFNLASNNLIEHVKVTCLETIIGFLLGTIMGAIIAILLWWSKFLSKVSEPFLVVLNSLPKVALRTNYYYLGWCRNECNYNYGINDFTNSNNIRNFKWLFKYR
jgi:NitT/TauT family transport system permease protein